MASTRVIKAAMVTPNLSIGGAERWVATMASCADPQKLQWTGFAVSGWGGLEPALCKEVTQVAPLFAGPIITETARKQATQAAVSPDCEQYIGRVASMGDAVALAARCADVLIGWGSYKYRSFLKAANMPQDFVLVSHSSYHKPHRITQVAHCRTHLVAVSEQARRPYQHSDNGPVKVIRNGVDTGRLQPHWGRAWSRTRWQVDDTHHVIGYIGRQAMEKNPAAAIHAMRLLDNAKWRAVYYGNLPQGHRPSKGNTLQLARETRWPHIQFYDPVINIGDVYHGIDVLMLASHSEACSLTLLEGWLTRTPVVATPVGAVPELQAEYGELVFQVPKSPTPQQLAAACERAVDPANAAIVERAYRVASQEFTAAGMMQRWVDYLDGILPTAATTRSLTYLDL